MILHRIWQELKQEAADALASEVRIGLGYTAVLLDSGRAGLAYTPREEVPPGCSTLPEAGQLAGRPAGELLKRLVAPSAIERAVALATANALLTGRSMSDVAEGDVLDVLALTTTDRVGMVGHFAPLESRLRARVGSLTIFEKAHRHGAGILPAEQAIDLLPACTVAIVTATALIGANLDPLLRAASACREVVLLGPSTPLCLEAFAAGPVSWLSGVVVTDPLAVLRVVSEGGGTREFGPFVRRVNLRVGSRSG